MPKKTVAAVLCSVTSLCSCVANDPPSTKEQVGATEQPLVFCNRTFTENAINGLYPYRAVGYINNGCTATIIDANHILSAAHCFHNIYDGHWQTDLRFYPNYHPDRPAPQPYGDIDRWVVGNRIWGASDWAIAHISQWHNTTGVDLTPVNVGYAILSTGTALSMAGYPRFHLPIETDAPHWDDVAFEGPDAGPSSCNGWVTVRRAAPSWESGHTECNSRWAAGIVVTGEVSMSDQSDNGYVIHSMSTAGGNSGSPYFYQSGESWWIGGVHSGTSGSQPSSNGVPVCQQYDPNDSGLMSWGPGSREFKYAPRFASSVAIGPSNWDPSQTGIYAVDSDTDEVVYRKRGIGGGYDSPFEYWSTLSTPMSGANLSKVAACKNNSTGRPVVFTVSKYLISSSKIHFRAADAETHWGSWTNFGTPSGTEFVRDIDAFQDNNGLCVVLAATENGAFMRRESSPGVWGSWSTIALATNYQAITGQAGGTGGMVDLYAAMVAGTTSTNSVHRTFRPNGSSWVSPTAVANLAGVAGWSDISMGLDEAGRRFLVAIPVGENGDVLPYMPMYGPSAWTWGWFQTSLWGAPMPTSLPDGLKTVTLSHWMEDPNGTVSPVIFATDDIGNPYFVEYSRAPSHGTPGWVLDWKTFSNKYIRY